MLRKDEIYMRSSQMGERVDHLRVIPWAMEATQGCPMLENAEIAK